MSFTLILFSFVFEKNARSINTESVTLFYVFILML